MTSARSCSSKRWCRGSASALDEGGAGVKGVWVGAPGWVAWLPGRELLGQAPGVRGKGHPELGAVGEGTLGSRSCRAGPEEAGTSQAHATMVTWRGSPWARMLVKTWCSRCWARWLICRSWSGCPSVAVLQRRADPGFACAAPGGSDQQPAREHRSPSSRSTLDVQTHRTAFVSGQPQPRSHAVGLLEAIKEHPLDQRALNARERSTPDGRGRVGGRRRGGGTA